MILQLALHVLLLAGAALAPALAFVGLWRRARPAMPASEALLASALTLPVFINAQVLLLGLMPWDRPLDAERFVYGAACVLSLVIAWVCRAHVAAVLREAVVGATRCVKSCAWLGLGVLLLTLLSFTVAFVWGVYNVPCAWDEVSYHMPQALQLLQDGRWGTVKTSGVWADSYGRGATTVYYWTLAILGTDTGIHPASASAGLVMALATYVAGRRLGLDRRWATIAGALTLTAPTVFYLCTIGYIDLFVGAAVTGALAFAAPERDKDAPIESITGAGGGNWGWTSLIPCLLATAFAMWMKVTVVVPLAVLAGLRGLWEIGVRVGRVPAPDGRPRPNLGAMVAAALVAVAAGSWHYVRTYVVYGTPTYPIQMKVGPWVLVDGPVTTQVFFNNSTLPLLQRLTHYWTGWFDELTAESRGALGPLFLIVTVAAGIVLVTAVVTRPRRWGAWTLPAAILLIAPVAPMNHVARYSVYILAPGALACAWLGQRLWAREDEREAGRGWLVALTALAAFNVYVSLHELRNLVTWEASLGIDLWANDRNRPVVLKYWHRQPGYPSGETMQKLQEIARPGDLVATVTPGLSGWFYTQNYDYRVEHRPALAWPPLWDPTHKPDHGIENQAAWLAQQQADKTAVVMAYKGSVEDRALAGPESGFELVYEEPGGTAGGTAGGTTPVVTPAIRIWQRRGR